MTAQRRSNCERIGSPWKRIVNACHLCWVQPAADLRPQNFNENVWNLISGCSTVAHSTLMIRLLRSHCNPLRSQRDLLCILMALSDSIILPCSLYSLLCAAMASVVHHYTVLVRALARCACFEGVRNKRWRLALKVAHGDLLPSVTRYQIVPKDAALSLTPSYLSGRSGSASSQVDLTLL